MLRHDQGKIIVDDQPPALEQGIPQPCSCYSVPPQYRESEIGPGLCSYHLDLTQKEGIRLAAYNVPAQDSCGIACSDLRVMDTSRE